MSFFEFRPGKLLERGDRKIERARGLLDSMTNPQDQQTAQSLLQSTEDFKPSAQRGMLTRFKQAMKYLRKASNALQTIESMPRRSRNHQRPNGNAHYSS